MKSFVSRGLLFKAACAMVIAFGALPSVSYGLDYGRYLDPSLTGPREALAGEQVEYHTPPLADSSATLSAEVKGSSIEFLGSEGSAKEGYRFLFKALRPGVSKVKIVSNTDMGSENYRSFEVKVVDESATPLLKIAHVMKNASKYQGKLFRISGRNRGWAGPLKGEILGYHATKSDWSLEDDTAACYVTGAIKQDEPRLMVVATTFRAGNEWGVMAVKITAIDEEPKDARKLTPDSPNHLKVGEVGVIEVLPDRSHTFRYEISGEEVSVAKEDRDKLWLKADKPGKVKVTITLHHFLEDNLDLPDDIKGKPKGVVYEIVVE